MAMNRKSGLYSLLVAAILLAVGIVLPFLTGNVQVLGQAISPLHIPVLICGLTCGWCWGMGLGRRIASACRRSMRGFCPFIPPRPEICTMKWWMDGFASPLVSRIVYRWTRLWCLRWIGLRKL